MIDEPTITLLAALYAELHDYKAKREKAARLLDADESEYRQKILAGWDYAIGVKQAQIEREMAKQSGSPTIAAELPG